jgi:hypothetical protein
MFLWTNISPGLLPVMTVSGTRESAQPIHSTYVVPLASVLSATVRTNLWGLPSCCLGKEFGFGLFDIDGPLVVGGEQTGEGDMSWSRHE